MFLASHHSYELLPGFPSPKPTAHRSQFDFFDAQAHFAFDVPSRARSKPMLANALLALSARHMHRTQRPAAIDEYLADRYNDACLRVLIPTLASDMDIEDDDLLATLCLLRLLEEIDGEWVSTRVKRD